LTGPIVQFQVFRNVPAARWTTYVEATPGSGFNEIASATAINASSEPFKRIITSTGLVDTGVEGHSCGNPTQNKCPLF
jgi:hypothetical protein